MTVTCPECRDEVEVLPNGRIEVHSPPGKMLACPGGLQIGRGGKEMICPQCKQEVPVRNGIIRAHHLNLKGFEDMWCPEGIIQEEKK